jgi:hypothetical protein
MSARRHQSHRVPQLGGSVTISNIRDRSGEGNESFVVAWHSNSGDLRWLSPSIASEETADVAAQILSSFTGATKR